MCQTWYKTETELQWNTTRNLTHALLNGVFSTDLEDLSDLAKFPTSGSVARESGAFAYRVRGHPGQMSIKKIRKRN